MYNTDQIRYTLSTILRTQGETLAAELLDIARPELVLFDHDFNTDLYRLDLRISPIRFAQIDRVSKQLEKLQKSIRGMLWKLGIDEPGSSISEVRILPELTVTPGAISMALPTPSDEHRLWHPTRVRLFISHVSRIKTETSALKQALAPLGIDSFVAHEDIQPTREWHREIEFALRSMQALCALITTDYSASQWCDQEVGYSLGRGIPVVLISCGSNPYGLMGKHQALRGDLSQPSQIATRLFDLLAKQEPLTEALTDGLVDSLVNAVSFADAKAGIRKIVSMESHLSKEQITRLLASARDNSQVREAINVPEQINAIAKRAKVTLPSQVSGEHDFDDDIPF